jgi:hypothetical protein
MDGGEGGINDSKYTGVQPPPEIVAAVRNSLGIVNFTGAVFWRCMNSAVYGCNVGASGRGCRVATNSEQQLNAIREYCKQYPNNAYVANAVNYSDSDWGCGAGIPYVVNTYPLDQAGYLQEAWIRVESELIAADNANTTSVTPPATTAPSEASPSVLAAEAGVSSPAVEPTASDTEKASQISEAHAAEDLDAVRAADPGAADHIAAYCAGATSSEKLAAFCRWREAQAWQRLVHDGEFPASDETTLRKCREPPFPDSYEAKEACLKYQLSLRK